METGWQGAEAASADCACVLDIFLKAFFNGKIRQYIYILDSKFIYKFLSVR